MGRNDFAVAQGLIYANPFLCSLWNKVLCERSHMQNQEICVRWPVLLVWIPQQCLSAAVEKAIQNCECFWFTYVLCVCVFLALRTLRKSQVQF